MAKSWLIVSTVLITLLKVAAVSSLEYFFLVSPISAVWYWYMGLVSKNLSKFWRPVPVDVKFIFAIYFLYIFYIFFLNYVFKFYK